MKGGTFSFLQRVFVLASCAFYIYFFNLLHNLGSLFVLDGAWRWIKKRY